MVDSITGNKGLTPLGNINRAGQTASAKNAGADKVTDRVDFSSALQHASKAQEVSSSQETSRSEKVQALKAQIEDGSYKPDLNKVASSILPFILKGS
ncbi:anti-sigma-28 factor, FlgM family [Desulfuromusa kysingii]|uniref:Negative regulator of flagellin synthesis n=1 Tax=Desulfuromusa kysingii TaxID=37625 RepID=A0A1H3VLW7_9BACT|nr:flagellar biosynthesis anti-sigma factor FlgM [Desulfuromusa kysingii]SDZ75749.1 anti-sigma-28 factor, FlgM family [Desulfuromusa kysingii]